MNISTLNRVKNALLSISIDGTPFTNIGHFQAFEAMNPPWIVWAEDNEYNSLEADDYKVGQTLEGTIDLFTKNEADPLFNAIQDALNADKIYFRLNSVQYEDETELIHYEWIWRISA